ncbi:MAG: type I DNA topoisomerase [Acidimicrobiales bacterium]|nr:type I DNA topoisomerase [Acidimicrobiales bacterium]
MAKPLVIVESPAKARTIATFLGNEFNVESSIGHIRDLPRSAAEVPEELKGESWSRLGVDPYNDFKPLYIVSQDKKSHVQKLKKLVKEASEVYLATDEDREGESIAWHLLEVLSPKVPVKRMVFHEITRDAINRAVSDWRELDRRLVDAQETRRILDRLYGYEVSPVLWRKVMPRLSAGRVQSVATRMVVERERARMGFRSASWWDLEASLLKKSETVQAVSIEINGIRLATGKDFDEIGHLTKKDVIVLGEIEARSLAESLSAGSFSVKSIEERPFRRSPAPPFMTSTLQQEAGRKLRFAAARTMRAAQRLYEEGWITYMRTDSTTLSDEAITTARKLASSRYGKNTIPAKPRLYANKVKNAQEAHEAIRPAGDSWPTPQEASRSLGSDESKLYELIWQRTVASQMVDANGQSVQVRIIGLTKNPPPAFKKEGSNECEAIFSASGRVITEPGFLAAYEEGNDDSDSSEGESGTSRLPQLVVGEALTCGEMTPKEHSTQPPPRYSEASLIKALEEMGVGRPSTYASIIDTIQQRGYVWKKGTGLVPTWTAFSVVGLLERYFAELVDYGFTASMEDDLDEIATGSQEMVPWLRKFYFGTEELPGLKPAVETRLGEIDAREINTLPIGKDPDGTDIFVRVGRYGPYIERGEDRASLPDTQPPDELTVELALEMLAAPTGDRLVGQDPETGLQIVAKAGRYGPYVQMELPQDAGKSEKPKTASLFKSMQVETVTLEDALSLFRLPRSLGIDESVGVEIVAKNGRYGPYLERGSDTRTLGSEEELLTVTMDEAKELFLQPKARRRQKQDAAPQVSLGEDPNSKKPILVKSGRFGPYVTDGETNASLRKGDTTENLTFERAVELLEERRSAAPRAPRAKKAAKKAVKKTAVKKAAKKTVKKAVAKKVVKKTATPKSQVEDSGE